MSIVYVTQDVMIRGSDGSMQRKFDLSQAEEFGELRMLVHVGQNIVSTVPVVRALNEQLRTYSEDDYLLLLGDPAIMAAASAIAAARNGGRFKVLKWDRRLGAYIPVQVDISGKATEKGNHENQHV